MLIKCIDSFVLASIVNVRKKLQGNRCLKKTRKETEKVQVPLKSGCLGTQKDILRVQLL